VVLVSYGLLAFFCRCFCRCALLRRHCQVAVYRSILLFSFFKLYQGFLPAAFPFP